MVVARMLEEEEEEVVVVLEEGCRSVALSKGLTVHSRRLDRSPYIQCCKLMGMLLAVLSPLGMSGVELVLDMGMGEEGRELGCRQVEGKEAAAEAVEEGLVE